MKAIKQISKILFAALIIVTSINSSIAQERKESFEKTYKLNSTGEFSFSCYDTDLKINTWKKDEVKLFGEIIIEGGKTEDQKKLIEVFKNPEVSEGNNSLKIETKMAVSTIIIGPFKKTTLIDGKTTIRVEKYKANYTLWIPESVAFNLKSKYNDINIATLTGKIDFELYDVDLAMDSFGEEGKFEMKYSSVVISKGGDAIMDMHDCEIEAKELNNVEINSKYSEIDISALNTLDFDSYDDEIEIGKINSLTSEAKYTNYRIDGDMKNCILTFYDSDIDAQNIGQLVFSAKYSSLDAKNVKSVKIEDIYDSNMELGIVGEFICNNTKYDEFKFDAITKSINMPNAYQSDLNIKKVASSFEGFSGNFKYGSVNMDLDSNLEFSLKYETAYGNVSFPKNRVKINDMNSNDSKQYFDGQTSDNPTCKIEFNAYNTEFNFTEDIGNSVKQDNMERSERSERQKR